MVPGQPIDVSQGDLSDVATRLLDGELMRSAQAFDHVLDISLAEISNEHRVLLLQRLLIVFGDQPLGSGGADVGHGVAN